MQILTNTPTPTHYPHAAPVAPLTRDERLQLAECEYIIHTGIDAFISVWAALGVIRDNRLYRETHANFEAYTRERWNIHSRQAAAQKIIAANIALRLSNKFDTSEMCLTHALELQGLDDEGLETVWRVVKDTAPDGKVTAKHVKSVVNVFRDVIAIGAIDDGTGNSIPAVGALHAAITEETYERMKRQQQHLAEKRGERLVAVTQAHVARVYHQEGGDYIVFRVSPDARAALAAGQDVKLVIYEKEQE